jgi:hypothetical protein
MTKHFPRILQFNVVSSSHTNTIPTPFLVTQNSLHRNVTDDPGTNPDQEMLGR